ncbi:site-specific DNA-methyltransferase [Tabrizicola thermarum]|uniref:site-specific DNA-methyltransferase n=1 Tax=Tabrizicola thermarum TaxID=2670345 RepID=UPI000FFB524D|nr:site-specific DNA-methyltransferase [Tabrizicola thermarum]
MTELVFKGKEFVWNHHLAVPFRPLVMHPDKGIGAPRLDGNLIVQGDNLHALKALLPMYAGRVDCIFIDPPYNTGNEGWAYNDAVNAPMIREWLDANPIGIEDGLRHDKWCAMMWPRLRLLHELLAEWGSIWITLDDNEAHRAKILLDEIFGEGAFVANMVWQKRYVANVTALHLSDMHDHVLVYAKNPAEFTLGKIGRTEAQAADYKNPDNDPRGPWRAQDLSASKPYKAGIFTITGPDGTTFDPPPNRYWRMNREQYEKWLSEGRISFGVTGKGRPMLKRFLTEAQDGLTPVTWWTHDFAGHNKEATLEMKDIFDGASPFDTPKPKRLISRILELIGDDEALVLDSFAGSGTTAHAVLEANRRDGGNRRFILVEMEDYADRLTAERVRRVINGYAFTGTQRTELLRESLTWTKLQRADRLTEQVEKIENLHGHEYDRITKQVKDGELIVTGEKTVADRAEGLGGEFTYCTLGAPVELDAILQGADLPSFPALAGVLFHMATSQPLDPAQMDEGRGYVGHAGGAHVWLIYRPDLDWLKSPAAALTLSYARERAAEHPGDRHLVFAPARHVSQRLLDAEGLAVEFVPLPFALYRVERV